MAQSCLKDRNQRLSNFIYHGCCLYLRWQTLRNLENWKVEHRKPVCFVKSTLKRKITEGLLTLECPRGEGGQKDSPRFYFDFLKSALALPTKFSIAVHYE